MTERNLAIRLSVMDGGKVKAELKEIGESGEKSLKKIELAGKPASKSLIALNAAANDVKSGAVGFPLRGFILCAHCGKPMTSCWSKGRNGEYPYYFCDTKGCDVYRKSIRKEKLEGEFQVLLEGLCPSEKFVTIAKEMFKEGWEARNHNKKEEVLVCKAELQAIERKEAQLLDRLVEADNPNLIVAYENRIKELGMRKIVLREKIEACGRPIKSFNEIYRTAFDFLKNPQKLWVSGDIVAQRIVLKLTFQEKLKYSRKEGF